MKWKMPSSQDFIHVTQHVQFFVVDKEKDVRNSIKEMLQSQNFMTHTSAGVVDTLNRLAKMDCSQKFIFLIEWKLDDCIAPQLAMEVCRRGIDAVYILITGGEYLALYDYLLKRELETTKLFTSILFKPVNFTKLMQTVNKHLVTGEEVIATRRV